MSHGANPSLIRRAVRALTDGPVHALDLAGEVIGLSGHPGAASAAVFQLLGADPRCLVDGEGMWSLNPTLAPLGAPLSEVRFAVVDVETTEAARGTAIASWRSPSWKYAAARLSMNTRRS